jgi:hypothetical protein
MGGKYIWQDIAIFGDSFCACASHVTDWPVALVTKLTGQVHYSRGKCFSGTAWWSTRQRLLETIEQEKPKILIFCHTNADRFPSNNYFGINGGVLDKNGYISVPSAYKNLYSKGISDAAILYYLHLYSKKYHLWGQIRWFKELDRLLKIWQIPIVIHLHAFENQNYVFDYGTTSKENLLDLCSDRLIWKDRTNVLFGKEIPSIRNHFDKNSNLKLADRLYSAIQEYDPNDRLKDLKLLG